LGIAINNGLTHRATRSDKCLPFVRISCAIVGGIGPCQPAVLAAG